jgi:DNA topoisomerase IA
MTAELLQDYRLYVSLFIANPNYSIRTLADDVQVQFMFSKLLVTDLMDFIFYKKKLISYIRTYCIFFYHTCTNNSKEKTYRHYF